MTGEWWAVDSVAAGCVYMSRGVGERMHGQGQGRVQKNAVHIAWSCYVCSMCGLSLEENVLCASNQQSKRAPTKPNQ